MSLLDRFKGFRDKAQIWRWVNEGMPLPPVPAAKRAFIHACLARHGLTTFIETGTFKGDTLASVAATGIRSISVELSHDYFNRANDRFAGQSHVELHQGDSGEILPRIVATLHEPALFWLDGHYSAGGTAHGDLASPINAEIRCIFESPVPGHVILVDDAHEFTGQGGYPPLGAFLTSITETGRWKAHVHANIIVIEPI